MSSRQQALERFAAELGYPLDQDVLVGGNYRPAVRHGGLVSVSGQLPRVGTVIACIGAVGAEVGLEDARRAACISALRTLHILHRLLGSLDPVAQLMHLGVYVRSAPDFIRQSEVADAASDLLQAVLGEAGVHARTSVGVLQLPKGAAVELNLTAAVSG